VSHTKYVDEERISAICDEIEKFFSGKGFSRPLKQMLAEVQSYGPFANEFVEDLRLLDAKGAHRYSSLNAYIAEAYSRAGRIRIVASSWNKGSKAVEERERKFRIEMAEPINWDQSPFVFSANVFIEDKYSTLVQCVVSDAELATIQIGSKSLSKRQARLRRLNEWYNIFRLGFTRYIEREWASGKDIRALKKITWAQVEASRK